MIYFTADQHFGHANIIKYCNRPFDNIDQMDNELINAWNRVVGYGDAVYHLGDFTLGNGGVARKYFRRLQGNIFILGNPWHHDGRWLPHWGMDGTGKIGKVGIGMFYSLSGAITIIPPLHVLQISGMAIPGITLCHYPLASWNAMHYGAWHLHGHSHGNYQGDGLIIDVGVDSLDCDCFTPLSLDRITGLMANRGAHDYS